VEIELPGVGQAQRRAGTRATPVPAPEQRCDAVPTAVDRVVAGQVGGSFFPAAFVVAVAGVAPEFDCGGAPGSGLSSTTRMVWVTEESVLTTELPQENHGVA